MSDLPPVIPVATYRLQFSRDFTFDDATAIVPYLAELGISHVYASPIFRARAGSTHGYDIVDYNQLNPELGTPENFARFHAQLRDHALGLILDFVPNHMGIGKADNPWWLDVLEWGQASPHSRVFDIDWTPPRISLAGKILLPILGQVYGAALCAGEIDLKFDADSGTFSFWYFDHRLPLSPRDYPKVLAAAIDTVAGLGDRRVRDAMSFLRSAEWTQDAAKVEPARDAANLIKATLAAAARDSDNLIAIDAPVAAWRGVSGQPESFVMLHNLLERQTYRLADWRVASDEINYRRFFDISDLAGIRVGDSRIFDATHRYLGELIEAGTVQGIRIDHIDGLADPKEYCRMLKDFAATRSADRAKDGRHPVFIVVEKILARHERLREDWDVDGTTGYDYLALSNGLFLDIDGEAAVERVWRRFCPIPANLVDEMYRCRRVVIENFLTSELAHLTDLMVRITDADWFTRDFTRQRLRAALTEIVAAFPVYRTYVTERGADDADLRDITWAIGQSKTRWTGTDMEILDFIGSVLTLEIKIGRPEHFAKCRETILRFVARFQQYTGPVSAKAIEDTLYYRHVPLVSANEVGCDIRAPGTSIEAFHQTITARVRRFPHSLLASATHDTKRGEDVRARINVLSEIPDEWARRLARWRLINRSRIVDLDDGRAPSENDEYLIYQTILGTWPADITNLVAARLRLANYVERLKAYAVKASREAKVMTSWMRPNERYEQRLHTFLDQIFEPAQRNPFLQNVMRIAPRIAHLGALNSLRQLVLKMTVPGVPDFYQGSEFWDLSLVDPDNRRPVDFGFRRSALDAVRSMPLDLAKSQWRSGMLKLWVMSALLDVRRKWSDLFRDGSYQRLAVAGQNADKIVAFSRRGGESEVVVAVSRFGAHDMMAERTSFWRNGDRYGGLRIEGLAAARYKECLSQAEISCDQQGVTGDILFAALPVAVLIAR